LKGSKERGKKRGSRGKRIREEGRTREIRRARAKRVADQAVEHETARKQYLKIWEKLEEETDQKTDRQERSSEMVKRKKRYDAGEEAGSLAFELAPWGEERGLEKQKKLNERRVEERK
jgi:hypothetical protein